MSNGTSRSQPQRRRQCYVNLMADVMTNTSIVDEDESKEETPKRDYICASLFVSHPAKIKKWVAKWMPVHDELKVPPVFEQKRAPEWYEGERREMRHVRVLFDAMTYQLMIQSIKRSGVFELKWADDNTPRLEGLFLDPETQRSLNQQRKLSDTIESHRASSQIADKRLATTDNSSSNNNDTTTLPPHLRDSLFGAVYNVLHTALLTVPETQLSTVEVEMAFGHCMVQLDAPHPPERLLMEVEHRVMLTNQGYSYFKSEVDAFQFAHLGRELKHLCTLGKFQKVCDEEGNDTATTPLASDFGSEVPRKLELKYKSGFTDVRLLPASQVHAAARDIDALLDLPRHGWMMKTRRGRGVVYAGNKCHVPVDFTVRVSTEDTSEQAYTQEPKTRIAEVRVKDRLRYELLPSRRWQVHLTHVVSLREGSQRYEVEVELMEKFVNGTMLSHRDLMQLTQEIVELSSFIQETLKTTLYT